MLVSKNVIKIILFSLIAVLIALVFLPGLITATDITSCAEGEAVVNGECQSLDEGIEDTTNPCEEGYTPVEGPDGTICIVDPDYCPPEEEECEAPQNQEEECSEEECPDNIDEDQTLFDNDPISNTEDIVNSPDLSNTSYNLLEPLGIGDNLLKTVNFIEECAFGKYLNIVVDLFLGVAALLAMVMLVVGGINYMASELVSTKEAAKKVILNAILGLLLALGAWLLLNTINPDLLKLCLGNLPTAQVQGVDIPQVPNSNSQYSIYINGEHQLYDSGDSWLVLANSLGVEAPTLPDNAEVYNSACVYIGQPNCTSLLGLNPDILYTVASNCECQLTITGGTETWLHSSTSTHGIGSATIDFDDSAGINFYLTGSQDPPTEAVDIVMNGITFSYEPPGYGGSSGPHWHVHY